MNTEIYQKLLEYSILIASKKRYTLSEMTLKLQKRFIAFCSQDEKNEDESLIFNVIERLKELDYLNDEKFVMDYINEKSKLSPRGRSYFYFRLKQKGIPKSAIDYYFTNFDFPEEELAEIALLKKQKNFSVYQNHKARNKAFQYLLSRGFSNESIYKAVDLHYSRVNEESYNN